MMPQRGFDRELLRKDDLEKIYTTYNQSSYLNFRAKSGSLFLPFEVKTSVESTLVSSSVPVANGSNYDLAMKLSSQKEITTVKIGTKFRRVVIFLVKNARIFS